MFPLLTPRTSISPLAAADVPAFVAYRQVPDVARWQSWDVTYSTARAESLVADQPFDGLAAPGEWVQLAVRDPGTGALLGDVAVHTLAGQPDTYELGVTVAPAAQGRGIATEAVARVLEHLFTDAGAHRVVAHCDARNEPVARLLRRVGLRHESRQVDGDWFKGEWTTLDSYAVLAHEWRSAGPAPG